MFKSEERTTKYAVILRPFHREHPPVCMVGYAKNEEDAANGISRLIGERYKECMDVKKASEIIWNKETVVKYWKQYADSETVMGKYRECQLKTQVF